MKKNIDKKVGKLINKQTNNSLNLTYHQGH